MELIYGSFYKNLKNKLSKSSGNINKTGHKMTNQQSQWRSRLNQSFRRRFTNRNRSASATMLVNRYRSPRDSGVSSSSNDGDDMAPLACFGSFESAEIDLANSPTTFSTPNEACLLRKYRTFQKLQHDRNSEHEDYVYHNVKAQLLPPIRSTFQLEAASSDDEINTRLIGPARSSTSPCLQNDEDNTIVLLSTSQSAKNADVGSNSDNCVDDDDDDGEHHRLICLANFSCDMGSGTDGDSRRDCRGLAGQQTNNNDANEDNGSSGDGDGGEDNGHDDDNDDIIIIADDQLSPINQSPELNCQANFSEKNSNQMFSACFHPETSCVKSAAGDNIDIAEIQGEPSNFSRRESQHREIPMIAVPLPTTTVNRRLDSSKTAWRSISMQNLAQRRRQGRGALGVAKSSFSKQQHQPSFNDNNDRHQPRGDALTYRVINNDEDNEDYSEQQRRLCRRASWLSLIDDDGDGDRKTIINQLPVIDRREDPAERHEAATAKANARPIIVSSFVLHSSVLTRRNDVISQASGTSTADMPNSSGATSISSSTCSPTSRNSHQQTHRRPVVSCTCQDHVPTFARHACNCRSYSSNSAHPAKQSSRIAAWSAPVVHSKRDSITSTETCLSLTATESSGSSCAAVSSSTSDSSSALYTGRAAAERAKLNSRTGRPISNQQHQNIAKLQNRQQQQQAQQTPQNFAQFSSTSISSSSGVSLGKTKSIGNCPLPQPHRSRIGNNRNVMSDDSPIGHSDGASTASSLSSSSSPLAMMKASGIRKHFEEVPPKIRSNRINVIREIIRTERTYAANLNGALHSYVRPSERRPDLFDKSWLDRVFSQLERVTEFSVAFLAKLEAALRLSVSGDAYMASVPHAFLQMFGGNVTPNGDGYFMSASNIGLDIYSAFCISEPLSELEFISLTNTSEAHRDFFDECRVQKNLVPVPFQSFLIAPVQRICQYQLLLSELLKATPENHSHRNETAAAASLMQRVATIINERRRQQEALERLALWQLAVDRWEGANLLERSTRFIHSGPLQEVKANGRVADRDCFIFDHQLIYCKRTALRMLVFKGRIDLDNSRIVPLMDGAVNGANSNSSSASLIRNAWRIDIFAERTPEILRSITFKTRSKEEKAEWMMALLKERKMISTNNSPSFSECASSSESRQLAWYYALKLFKEQTHSDRGFGNKQRRVASVSYDHQSSPFPSIFGSARQQASAEACRRLSGPLRPVGPVNVAFTPDSLPSSLGNVGNPISRARGDKEKDSSSKPHKVHTKRRSRSTIRAEDIVRVPGGGRLMVNCVQTDV